ncbi:uncharacterized protein LOC123553429 isoform X2 [Mercenaria mercenaria]|uniref:uncharacterized protein LOC123553429 isoform X2 n=1 Tax=Mercenaria mercenaria TaxID=6596 RepID=UPI00234EE2AA|nr:uncharacterized protein LOC123553429 isoform X2 [Mercenaria mercenaria]
MGCRDTAMCPSATGKRSANVTAADKRSSGKHLVCSDCCHGDLCNSALCGQPGYPSASGSRGPLCYSCDQQLSTDSCSAIKECGRNVVCSLKSSESSVVATDKLFTTECQSKHLCEADLQAQRHAISILGRKRYSDHVMSASGHLCLGKCCDSDLCNSNCTSSGCKNPSYTPIHSAGVCLKITLSNLTYYDARTSCKQDGGDLVIVNSKAKFDAVSKLTVHFGYSRFWVGLHRDAPLSTYFSWVDGARLTSSNGGQFWGREQPNNSNGIQDCALLEKLIDDSLLMYDVRCNRHDY